MKKLSTTIFVFLLCTNAFCYNDSNLRFVLTEGKNEQVLNPKTLHKLPNGNNKLACWVTLPNFSNLTETRRLVCQKDNSAAEIVLTCKRDDYKIQSFYIYPPSNKSYFNPTKNLKNYTLSCGKGERPETNSKSNKKFDRNTLVNNIHFYVNHGTQKARIDPHSVYKFKKLKDGHVCWVTAPKVTKADVTRKLVCKKQNAVWGFPIRCRFQEKKEGSIQIVQSKASNYWVPSKVYQKLTLGCGISFSFVPISED
ncbi:MAG: hypothetical protein ISR65_19100 [Bacteriovoracaceae bacterium]|nr:hypothetical protein [Bacteriovoracaceae bacterium]